MIKGQRISFYIYVYIYIYTSIYIHEEFFCHPFGTKEVFVPNTGQQAHTMLIHVHADNAVKGAN